MAEESDDTPPRSVVNEMKAELTAIFAEMAQRKSEALRLYEPLPLQEAFHRCTAPERIVRGSNRAGKTLSTHVELARAFLGRDPYQKYPSTDGRAFLVGKDGRHTGDVMYRKLYRPGSFRIIRDDRTQLWRSWRPWDPEDEARHAETKPAPPLIPPRYVTEVAWENKKAGIPKMVRHITGWEASFYSSMGKPPTGSDVDLAAFDEEIIDSEWYPEIAARLLDRGGKFIWGATPQAGTEQLYQLHMDAERLEGTEHPRVVEFVLLLADNPHIDQKKKDLLAAKYTSPEQYRIRIKGEFAIVSLRVYPEFAVYVHMIEPFDIPESWTRYAIVDPGHQRCGVLFIATPPDGHEKAAHRYAFDELYIQNCTAKIFGQAMKDKCEGHWWQSFLIDGHAGRHTDVGAGRTVEDQYTEALREHGVKSATTGSGFQWGTDDLKAGLEEVRSWLIPMGPSQPPKLHIFNTCSNLKWEMLHYHKRSVGNGINKTILDEPVKKNDHLVDTLRYAACHGCDYVPPKQAAKRASYAVRAARALMKKLGGGAEKGVVNLGPGG